MQQGVPSLPFEVLIHIFDLAIDKESRMTIRDPPMNLSQTCRAWRTYIISKPKYWKNINATDTDPKINRNLWLERSPRAPLSGSVRFLEGSCDGRKRLRSFLRKLVKRQERWWSMSILFFSAKAKDRTPSRLELRDLRKLRDLAVVHPFPFGLLSDPHPDNVYPLFVIPETDFLFALAPKLTRLVCTIDVNSFHVRTGLLAMLVRCPSLVHLYLEHRVETYPDEDDEREESTAHMPNLAFLTYQSYSGLGLLHTHIIAPALKSLALCSTCVTTSFSSEDEGDDDDDDDDVHILDFFDVEDSPDKISSAYFETKPMSGETIVNIMEYMPVVKELAFMTLSGLPLEALVPGPEADSKWVCPLLELLRITCRRVDCDVLENVLRHRIESNSNFQIHIHFLRAYKYHINEVRLRLAKFIECKALHIKTAADNLNEERRRWNRMREEHIQHSRCRLRSPVNTHIL